MTDTQHALALFDLITAHRITASLYTAAELGIADALADGPCTVDELSVAVDALESALGRLLRALVTIGVCRRVGAGKFGLTPVGRHLASGSSQSLKAWAIFEGKMLQPSWGGLIDSVPSGKTRAELAGVASSFDLMARDPHRVEMFNAAMRDLTRLTLPAVLATYDFSGISRLIDVGGGTGELLAAVLLACPSLRGAVFDQAACAEGARKHFRDSGISDRAEFIAGDFFKSIPGDADALILKSTIHDWNDECSACILANCRKVLPASGKLILVERIMPEAPTDDADHRAGALSDLNMLRGPGGHERTAHEYGMLLNAAGFRIARIIPACRFSLIEALVA
jgi:hypothetical protein